MSRSNVLNPIGDPFNDPQAVARYRGPLGRVTGLDTASLEEQERRAVQMIAEGDPIPNGSSATRKLNRTAFLRVAPGNAFNDTSQAPAE